MSSGFAKDQRGWTKRACVRKYLAAKNGEIAAFDDFACRLYPRITKVERDKKLIN